MHRHYDKDDAVSKDLQYLDVHRTLTATISQVISVTTITLLQRSSLHKAQTKTVPLQTRTSKQLQAFI